MKIHHQRMKFQTRGCLEFTDITLPLMDLVDFCEIQTGVLNVQSQHTTASIFINENEPLLLNDITRTLERVAPQDWEYLHNDFRIRTVNMTEKEDRNGHSHCKAIFLPTSQTINIVDGKLELGTWQRVFLLELDCSKERSLSIVLMGDVAPE